MTDRAPAFVVAAAFFTLLLILPAFVQAIAGAQGGGPHPMCIKWVIDVKKAQAEGKPPPPPYKCSESSPQGAVPGLCKMDTLCKATSAPGGNLDQGMQGLGQMLQSIMGMLKPKGGGGGGGGGGGQGQGQGQPGNAQNPYASLYPPCQYSPTTNEPINPPCTDANGAIVTGSGGSDYLSDLYSESDDLSDSLLDSLLGGGGGEEEEEPDNVSDDLADEDGGDTGDGSGDESGGSATSTTATTSAGLSPQTRGDIVTGERGATVVGGSRDEAEGVEVAGFIGAGSGNIAQSTSLVGRLCISRPWASGFFSKIITPAFFDGLCKWRGYQVGPLSEEMQKSRIPAATKTVNIVSRKTATSTPPPPLGEPKVDVWATPDQVPLGTRTSIFWVSENVYACKVTGPSFTQDGISGAAATVPIAIDSTFTATCLDAEGNEVTSDSVTVELSI